MLTPPDDAEHRLIRVGLAVTCAAAAIAPWLSDHDTTVTVWVYSALGMVAAALLIVSAFVQLSGVLEPALTLAAAVLLFHGFYFALNYEHQYDGATRAQEALLGFGIGLVALAQLMALAMRRRRAS
jgi:hypothetical protein